jgi:hypothetical protein
MKWQSWRILQNYTLLLFAAIKTNRRIITLNGVTKKLMIRKFVAFAKRKELERMKCFLLIYFILWFCSLEVSISVHSYRVVCAWDVKISPTLTSDIFDIFPLLWLRVNQFSFFFFTFKRKAELTEAKWEKYGAFLL